MINIKPNKDKKIYELIEQGKITIVEAFSYLNKTNYTNKELSINNSSNINEIIDELDSLIGMHKIKSLIREIKAYAKIQSERERQGLINETLVLHMIFKGNPGTGKTTVARLLGRIFKHLKLLEKGHIIEVERADLVGEYIGHTAQKTKEVIKKSIGGILFIDEAYALARGGERDFGKEAIDTLVKSMEDYKSNIILILAGYKEEMEFFLRTNPGLRSRFPIHLTFEDYTITEMLKIAEYMLKSKEYKLSNEAILQLKYILEDYENNIVKKQGNARFVRNIIEKSIRNQAVRLCNKSNLTKKELMIINEYDLKGVILEE